VTLVGLATILPWVLVAFGCVLGYLIMRQSERTVESLEALEQKVDLLQDEVEELMPPEPLHEGAEAPEFVLPSLEGRDVSLEELRGKRVLLVFFSPTCPYCQEMAPELAKVPFDTTEGLPVPVVIAVGEEEANRALAQEHGIRFPFLLDAEKEVVNAYYPEGTPAAYLIDENGFVTRERLDGAESILAVAATPDFTSAAAVSAGESSVRDRSTPAATVAAESRAEDAGSGDADRGIGVGDLIKAMTDKLGIKACRGCERRRVALNRWVIGGSKRERR